MKKIIQISLVVVLVLVLFQAVNAGSITSSDTVGAGPASRVSTSANASSEGVQMVSCLDGIKDEFCVQPNVGWNS